MAKFLIIGPLTRDRIVKKDSEYQSIGGAVYYQSAVFSYLGIDNTVITTLAEKDKDLIDDLPEATEVIPIYTDSTMEFQNIYPNNNPNYRIQKAFIPENPIRPENLFNIDLKVFDALLLCPLSSTDIPLNTLKYLAQWNIPIYLGAQGYLRHKKNGKVVLKPWYNYKKFLNFIQLLFIDEIEARIILGVSDEGCGEVTRKLSSFGPEEVIVTRGDQGAFIYSKKDVNGNFYHVPAIHPHKIIDPTGLGDTFMAAYAARRIESDDPEDCGIFASRISSLKMEQKGALKLND